ncbi:MAG TPA: hypothetical protein VLW53_03210, partial [Candidatus Eisenbacteria bacterium]|nr:hypothetical protein [Candidatus Eisenbacteria bacterium]
MRTDVAFGVATRTGSATVVALTGSPTAPRLAVRREIPLVPSGLPRQPFHAAAGTDAATAGRIVAQVEEAAAAAAATGLRALADGLAAGVLGVAVV